MKVVGLQTFIWKNNARSLFLLLIFPLLIGILCYLVLLTLEFSEGTGDMSAFYLAYTYMQHLFWYIVAGVGVWFGIAWLFHKSIILGMTNSKPLERKENVMVYDIVQKLCISRGLPMPKLYVIEDTSMNAFASGLSPKNSLISFSRGLLDRLNEKEIEAVAAHELSHIINRDIRLMVIAIIFVGIIQTLTEMILRARVTGGSSKSDNKAGAFLMILAIKAVAFLLGIFFTSIIQLAISRKREFLADAGCVELTKTSEHLISALEKIHTDSRIEVVENRNVAQMCIENPLERGAHMMDSLFSTHPSLEARVAALRAIS